MRDFRSPLAAAVLGVAVLAATPAFAFHCPQEMAKIDKALAANPKLSQADLTKVRQLRTKGEAEHKAGDHQASLDTLAQAEKLLAAGTVGVVPAAGARRGAARGDRGGGRGVRPGGAERRGGGGR